MRLEQLSQISVIAAAGLSVALADVLIKKVGAVSSSIGAAVVHPLIVTALGLYALQIVLFAYVFVRRWELGIVALLQMSFYAATCVLVGRYIFHERVTFLQGLGMVLALCGTVLMTSGSR